MNRQEEWRSVLGFPKYEVSDMGVIRGLRGKGKIMRPTLSKPGYLRLNLFNKGEKSYKSVHVVVLTAFKGPRPDGYDARHINGIKQDNRNINLEWGTSVQNMNDKIDNSQLPTRRSLNDATVYDPATMFDSNVYDPSIFDTNVYDSSVFSSPSSGLNKKCKNCGLVYNIITTVDDVCKNCGSKLL